MDEGVVPGGGATYVHLSELVPAIKISFDDLDEQIGADIVAKVWFLFSFSSREIYFKYTFLEKGFL